MPPQVPDSRGNPYSVIRTQYSIGRWSLPARTKFASGWGMAVSGWDDAATGRADRPRSAGGGRQQGVRHIIAARDEATGELTGWPVGRKRQASRHGPAGRLPLPARGARLGEATGTPCQLAHRPAGQLCLSAATKRACRSRHALWRGTDGPGYFLAARFSSIAAWAAARRATGTR